MRSAPPIRKAAPALSTGPQDSALAGWVPQPSSDTSATGGAAAPDAAASGLGSTSGGGNQGPELLLDSRVGDGWRPYVDGGGGTGNLPSTPEGIYLQDLSNGGEVLLTWVNSQTDTLASLIERESFDGSDWGLTEGYTTGPTERSFQNIPGTGTFRYRVATVNAQGTSAYTPWASIDVTSMPPAQPTSFQAAGQYMTWGDASSNESGFELFRERQSGSSWVDAASFATSANVVTYFDSAASGTYRYHLRSFNVAGVSPWVGPVFVTMSGSPPNPPSNLLATDAGNRRALISWTDNSAGTASFQIERSPAFSGGLVNVAAGVTGYLDASGAGTFSYRVRSTNSAGSSAYTNWVSVNVADTTPAPPTNLAVSDLGNQSQCRVSWVDNSNNETSFKLERDKQQTGGTWGGTIVLTSGANTASYTDNPGLGTFRYRAASVNSAGTSTWTGYVVVTISSGGGGWTAFNPSSDSRLIYVSASAGNDANSGLTQGAPKRTLAAAYGLLRNGYPDWMQLKAGDVWNERMPTWGKSGRSATERMLVTSYGTGARPRIQTGSTTGMDTSTAPINNIAFVSLNFIANTWTGATSGGPTGMYFVCEGGSWVIEDCLFERYANNLIIQGWPRLNNIKLRRNIFWNPMRTDTGNTNVYIDNVDNLALEENLFVNLKANDSMTATGGTLLSHNAYLHESCGALTVVGNIAYNGRTNFTCRPGGLVKDNLSIRGGQGFQVGWNTHRASTVMGNVCTETRNHWNGQPLGQGIVLATGSGSVVSYNLIANSTEGLDHYAMWFEADNRAVEVKNNVAYNWSQPTWESPLLFFNGLATGPINVHHNDFQQVNAKLCVQFLNSLGPWVSFSSNRYYTPRTGYCGDAAIEWTFSQWKTLKESTAIAQQVSYPAPSRSIGSYNASLGGAANTEAFLLEAKNNSKSNWRPQYTANAVNNYLRAGFGMTLPPN